MEPSGEVHEAKVMKQWRHTTRELQTVDGMISELREELRRIERRRAVVASRTSALEWQISAKAAAEDSAVDGEKPIKYTIGDGAPDAETDDEWEQGLAVIEQAGRARDRASLLRVHLMCANQPPARRCRSADSEEEVSLFADAAGSLVDTYVAFAEDLVRLPIAVGKGSVASLSQILSVPRALSLP
uniref:Uncharacterized protein n=1 Tax=Noctiluca scintillans TaxID=2966 RepID=A0A7S1EXX1_NOCSC|mmetsp:Transcript_15725/g.42871  ORF Transcript_15725/g.42871 Transcript_15725/m.42871 type:complete len:186 (+) Transcript_15725:1-558(+)